jgi:hypothetical protein
MMKRTWIFLPRDLGWLLVVFALLPACSETVAPARCGDGVWDAGEECDDGAANSDELPDACRTDCRQARCGDAVVDTLEACDEGEGNSAALADACRPGCVAPACGDGVTDTGEECDDGSSNSDAEADACRSDCREAFCGDGVIDANEECEPTADAPCGGRGCDGSCACNPADPCAVAPGDPNCYLLVIDQQGIGACGFGRAWRGQDLSFPTDVVVTGVEFKSNGTVIDEIRLMTDIAGLTTLAASTSISRIPAGFPVWERAEFLPPAPLAAGVEYTAWFHLVTPAACTSGCNLLAEDPSWGGHHTDTDPVGQTPGALPQWNYDYGTNLRVYGYIP